MSEGCLRNNWSFGPIFFNIYRALMRWSLWSFLGRCRWWVSTIGGTHIEWELEGRGLSLKFFRMRVYIFHQNTFLRGTLTSHFMEEHSSPTHRFPIFMMTSSNGNVFCVTGPLCREFTGHRWIPLTKASYAKLWCFLWPAPEQINNQDAVWFETPLRSLWRHCNVVPSNDLVIRTSVGSFGVQRVTLVQFWIGKTGQVGGFRALWKKWHTVLPWLPFLEINYILHKAVVVCGVRSTIN